MSEVNAFEAIENITAFWVGDWAEDRRLFWLYGILAGWDDDSLEEFKKKRKLNDLDIERLKTQREQYMEARRLWMNEYL